MKIQLKKQKNIKSLRYSIRTASINSGILNARIMPITESIIHKATLNILHLSKALIVKNRFIAPIPPLLRYTLIIIFKDERSAVL